MSYVLHHGDCLEVMADIPDGSIDMVLCDLPYGSTKCHWDSVIPFAPLWSHYKRVIKRNGAIVLFGTQPFTTDLIQSNRAWFRQELIWKKPQGVDFYNGGRRHLKAHENAVLFCEGQPCYNPQKRRGKPYTTLRNRETSTKGTATGRTVRRQPVLLPTVNNGDRCPTSVLEFATDTSEHATAKPIPLLAYLIRTYTNEGETVLDNTCGSGSTGVACIQTARNFIGIEKDAGYFAVAERRLRDAQPGFSFEEEEMAEA